MEKRKLIIISLFLMGLFFILNSSSNITGAVVGISITQTENALLALTLIFTAGLLSLAGAAVLPQRIHVSSVMDRGLKRYAEKTERSQDIRTEMQHLKGMLDRGNVERAKYLPNTDGIHYLSGRNGARLYYKQTRDGFAVVGESNKGNQQGVIDLLRREYSR